MVKVKTEKAEIECRVAESSFQKFIGLMFKREIEPLFFDLGKESRFGCAVHTCFMLKTIDIVFMNKDKVVVDIQRARPFRFLIVPKEPARYVLELPLDKGKVFRIGELVNLT